MNELWIAARGLAPLALAGAALLLAGCQEVRPDEYAVGQCRDEAEYQGYRVHQVVPGDSDYDPQRVVMRGDRRQDGRSLLIVCRLDGGQARIVRATPEDADYGNQPGPESRQERLYDIGIQDGRADAADGLRFNPRRGLARHELRDRPVLANAYERGYEEGYRRRR
jgi:hypothetical protein